MNRKSRPPFPQPSSREWVVSLRQTYRQRADFYKLLILASILVLALYLAFTWVAIKGDDNTLRPGSFFLVSWADVHADIEQLALTVDPDARLAGAQFMVWPYVDEELEIRATIVYSSQSSSGPLRFYVSFVDGRYRMYSNLVVSDFLSPVTLEPGNASSLPEEVLFPDSLLAFESLFPQQELAIRENYSDIAWPMVLRYSRAPLPIWELCYSLEQTDYLSNCVQSSGIEEQ